MPDQRKPSARFSAAKAVHEVLNHQAQLETALSGSAGFSSLGDADRAFARLIAATTLRRHGQLNLVLKAFVDRPPGGLASAILQTGATQILFLNTPAHAAVGEAVSTARMSKKASGYAGLINAVLRRVDREGKAVLARTAPQDNLPNWIRRNWDKAYGRATTRKLALQLTQVPPLDIYVPQGNDDWAEALGGDTLGSKIVRLSNAGNVSRLEGYQTGKWWVQDVAATVPVACLGDVSGLKVLDMCAAPGGKTLQLSASGASVTAMDKSEARLDMVRENLSRTKLSAEIITADALEWDTDERFDVIILDAPCTATGTFRRHPDVLQNKSPQSLQSLVKLQKALLERAATWLKPDGRLVYCTCSLQAEEGEAQIDQFLKRHPEWATAIPDSLPEVWNVKDIVKDGYVRILPHLLRESGGSDGFFTAVLTKRTR